MMPGSATSEQPPVTPGTVAGPTVPGPAETSAAPDEQAVTYKEPAEPEPVFALGTYVSHEGSVGVVVELVERDVKAEDGTVSTVAWPRVAIFEHVLDPVDPGDLEAL
jgi:hypothetical protein